MTSTYKSRRKKKERATTTQKIKFDNFPWQSCYYFSARVHDYADYRKVAKIAGRHKIAFIKAEGYVSQLSATQEKPKDSFSMSGNAQRSPHLAVKWLD